MVIGPEFEPFEDDSSRPSLLAPAVPLTSIVCPAARMLSFAQDVTLGQVNVSPSALTVPPGVSPAAARACAE